MCMKVFTHTRTHTYCTHTLNLFCMDVLINQFLLVYSTSVLITRKMEEVPCNCLLKRAEQMEELKTVLFDIDLLIVLHYRYSADFI